MAARAITDARLRRFTGYTMKRAMTGIQTDVNTALAPLGLRMLSFSALSVIAENPGLRQSQLAEALLMERPNMTPVVDALERSGWIARAPAPDDRRAYALTLTDAGTQVFAAAERAVEAHEAHMTGGLSTRDRDRLIAMLREIETVGVRGGNDG
jgi:DNA-binding MarR family transcriptional regulator